MFSWGDSGNLVKWIGLKSLRACLCTNVLGEHLPVFVRKKKRVWRRQRQAGRRTCTQVDYGNKNKQLNSAKGSWENTAKNNQTSEWNRSTECSQTHTHKTYLKQCTAITSYTQCVKWACSVLSVLIVLIYLGEGTARVPLRTSPSPVKFPCADVLHFESVLKCSENMKPQNLVVVCIKAA